MNLYQQLASLLAEDGLRCHFQTPGQMVVSAQQGPIWPDRGNSFWVTYAFDQWHLFTWSPVGYRVPKDADIARLCRVCMAHGTCAMPTVPTRITREFALSELSDQETKLIYTEMIKHAKSVDASDPNHL